MTQIIIDIPSSVQSEMARLFAKGKLSREEGLETACKINVDFLLAQLFHPFNSKVGARRITLRQIGKAKAGLPHLAFIETDKNPATKPTISFEVSPRLHTQAVAFASLRDESVEELARSALVGTVKADREDLVGVGAAPEEEGRAG